MRYPTALSAAMLVSLIAVAQPEPVPCAVMAPVPPPCSDGTADPPTATDAPAAHPPLARLDGFAITETDLEQRARAAWAARDAAVTAARRKALRAEIDDVLLEREAERRGIPVKELWLREVVLAVPEATEEDLRKEYEAHPEWYLDEAGKPREEARTRAAGILHERREAERATAYARGLEARFPVAMGVDAATDPLPAGAVLATVGGWPLTAARAGERIVSAGAEARHGAAEDVRDALDAVIRERLLKAEAAKKLTTPEELTKAAVTARIGTPTETELRAAWEPNKRFFGDDFAKAKKDVATFEHRRRQSELAAAFDADLRKGHDVRLLVPSPERAVQRIEVAGHPSEGDPAAKAVLVEFGDFQCPPCGRVAQLLDEVLPAYGGRVRYVFRESPLRIHPFAAKAAEAALAAHAQGRFFPYARILFAHQGALDVASLRRYAAEAGLDVERFSRDLDAGRFAADVWDDRRAARRLGVRGTPALFLNGVFLELKGFGPGWLREELDRVLARAAGAGAGAAAVARR